MRHSLARWDEFPRTDPTTTSPTSDTTSPVRSTVALRRVATRSSAGVSFRPPFLARVIGVRSAETTTMSSGDFLCVAWCWCDGVGSSVCVGAC